MPNQDAAETGPSQSAQRLAYLKKVYNIQKVNADKEKKKLEDSVESGNLTATTVDVSCSKIRGYITQLHDIERQLLAFFSDSEIDALLQRANSRDEDLTDLIYKAESLLRQQAVASLGFQTPSASNSIPVQAADQLHHANSSKLPKLDLPKFTGDPLKWHQFWDGFNAAVHSRGNLAPVEKFQYLRKYLTGDALQLIEGYALTDSTYETALAALKKRYDQPELCINSHLESIIYMPECSNNSHHDMQKTFDACEAHVRSLVALGMSEDTFGRVFAPLILSKFPHFVRIELNRRNGIQPWTLENVRKHIEEELLIRRMGAHRVGSHRFERTSRVVSVTKTNTSLLASGEQPKLRYPCGFCGVFGHRAEECKKHKTVEDRKRSLKENNRCFLCLRPGHGAKTCEARRACRNCESNSHHHSLCPKKYVTGASNRESTLVSDTQNDDDGNVTDTSLVATQTNILTKTNSLKLPVAFLATAKTHITGRKATAPVRVVLDTCSTRSYARLDVLHRIDAKKICDERLGLAGLQAEKHSPARCAFYEIILHCKHGRDVTMGVSGLRSVTAPVTKQAIKPSEYPILRKFELADDFESSETDVQLDVLIGLDQYYRLVSGIKARLDEGLVLLDTKLGIIPNGSKQAEDAFQKASTALIALDDAGPDAELESNLERLWRMEDVGVTDAKLSSEDEIAETKFKQSIQFNETEKRYYVAWPWKHEENELPENYGLALGRLRSLLRRLDKPTLEVYDKTIRDQFHKGVIEVAPKESTGGKTHYLPHHCVIRPDKATTKLRVVYDASAKSNKTELSLNESMYRGPVLLPNLCGLIFRFREKPVGVVSDVEKAFLQIMLHEKERDVTRFLWLKDSSKPPSGDNLVVYRFARVLFGIVASPYMLSGTIQHHLSQLSTPAAQQIMNNCYVDNVIVSHGSDTEAQNYYREAKHAFSLASMNLREWFTNSQGLLNLIPEKDRGTGVVTTVLGLQWNTETDTLSCQSKMKSSIGTSATKRSMLRAISQLFDPCGFLAPVTVVGKVIIQELWKEKTNWDEVAPEGILNKWNKFEEQLLLCPTVQFPRCLDWSSGNAELHVFCDASWDAYACAVYVRTCSSKGIKSSLLFAKVRVSPVKGHTLTIPKLELTALLMGCKIANYVRIETKIESVIHVWSDSQCTLFWVNKDAQTPVFVKNRVTKIRQMDRLTFRYVPTAENPADLPTRGMSIEELRRSSLWWHGPEWLQEDATKWPKNKVSQSNKADKTNNRDEPTIDNGLIGVASPLELIDLSRYSTFERATRVMAWVLRFCRHCKSREHRGSHSQLTAAELTAAETAIIRLTQANFIATQNDDFKKCKLNLKLFTDEKGVLRCSGKTDNADEEYDARFPIFIPRKTKLMEMLITHYHVRLAHAGTQHVLRCLRGRYWVPRGRCEVKRVLRTCHVCIRWKGGSFRTPDPPPLPNFRSSVGTAFSAVGLDYLGPLVVRHRDKSEGHKVWLCLYTCCRTRAVDIEVVDDMSTDQFLLGLRRFIAKFGCPGLIVLDNATQFKLGERITNCLWEKAVRHPDVDDFCSRNRIKYKYIVESAPWMGGLYERMVGIAKKALRCAIHNQLLTLEELQTVCAEICAILNSRPLTYVDDEVESRALSPADLIQWNRRMLPMVSIEVDEDYYKKNSTKEELIKTWKRLDKRVKCFWDVWKKDYIAVLRERPWFPKNHGCIPRLPQIDEVVLVKHDLLPRGQWQLGKVVDLVHSADGSVRSAKVRTPSGRTLHRPLKLLYPTEAQPEMAPEKPEERGLEPTEKRSESRRPQRCAAKRANAKLKELMVHENSLDSE